MRFNSLAVTIRRLPRLTHSTLKSPLLLGRYTSPHRHYSTSMPAKRKRAEAHQSEPKPTSVRRRRSSRIVDKDSTVASNSVSPPETETLGVIAAGPKRARRSRNGKGGDTKEEVQRAMQNLQDMENQLQSAVKRQQLAVETSDLGCEIDPDVEGNVTLPGKRWNGSTSTVINERDREQAATEEQAPLDGDEAKVAKEDVEPGKMESDGVERGARRLPPVNSETLPLPWKGRLGYVRSLTLPRRPQAPPILDQGGLVP